MREIPKFWAMVLKSSTIEWLKSQIASQEKFVLEAEKTLSPYPDDHPCGSPGLRKYIATVQDDVRWMTQELTTR